MTNAMNDSSTRIPIVRRWSVGLLGGVSSLLIIWWMAANSRLQIILILGVFVLLLETVFLVTGWRQGLRWFFSRRALRFYGWLAAGLISVVVLFYTEESWRGRRAWARVQHEAAARNEVPVLSALIPPPVPERQNFALAPGVGRVLGYAESGQDDFRAPTNSDAFYHGTRDKWPTANWALQQPTDLEAWQTFFRKHPAKDSGAGPKSAGLLAFPVATQAQAPAADVLVALSAFDSDLAVLQAASERPEARYPMDYSQGWFALWGANGALLESLYRATHLLCLRASAELAQGQSEAAVRDTWLALRLPETLRREPYAQAHRYRAEMLMCGLQPIWEGLRNHHWTGPQLAAFQKYFEKLNLLSDFRCVTRGETLLKMDLADQFRAFLAHKDSSWTQRLTNAESADRFWIWFARAAYPTGWFDQDKAWLYRFYQRYGDAENAQRLEALSPSEWESALRSATDPLLLIMIVPRLRQVFSDGLAQALFLQTACQEATVGCALERYRLTHGKYPATLDGLVPGFLKEMPSDLLARASGPLHYRRLDDDHFLVYSVGLNRRDDGGKPGRGDDDWRGWRGAFPRFEEGDWVWEGGG
jgi:hypothetical protein